MSACIRSGKKAATGACAGTSVDGWKRLRALLFTRENLWALLVCLVAAALTVLSADLAPTWIYQGF